jgi:RNA polymerase sigma-70 factor (ECF subfamily)
MTTPEDPQRSLPFAVQGSWQSFLRLYEPLRPELYRYCRYLTRSPWDAEDLAQDTMMRAFVALGLLGQAPANPRAWLFKVASNWWIDQQRRKREWPSDDPEVSPHAASEAPELRDSREAAGTLITRLSPQERAAVVLKDVFELNLDEVADALSTSVGAVKTALHRGRGKLVAPEPADRAIPVAGALDAFCEAFNARDLERLTALLLDSATVEVVGVTTQYGPNSARRGVLHGMLHGSGRLAEADTRGGIEAHYMQGVLPLPPRAELRVHRGEAIVLVWYAHADGEAVRAINRFDADGEQISRLRNYFFTPDLIAEVCHELCVPYRVNGYRYWLTGC